MPEVGEAIFVMEYIHGDLGSVPIDFRIIRNETGLGRFAGLEDVQKIDDLDSLTVFYQAPAVAADVFTVIHEFKEEGDFLGIVTATRAGTDQVYSAVFPFEVGFTGFGLWPLFIVLALVIQFAYWLMNGGYSRWRQSFKPESGHA
ncbi:MAG: hypothetical protein RQ899_11495 [Pseudomonadales bacterium]|nr:hypothetical protein [Pseudomonadales bacterium]